ncbi:ABC-2 type transport system permease protein [Allocatelliglobosispora scoriae]|uniref:ABC-2 type transport system permease protein n=1 Tax=Allocatelliglobosispora scoriae TaxID=643052 RepID=A0A841BLB5_9ACTN|nr:ABC transporter permease [Allocatelliglobosispora scoriae]MBB5868158.1 ABC-2 type transport system permease protein [Allocatelliglobosispora scoriae]
MTTLAGTGSLVRLILRRDRVLMPIWVLLMSLLPLGLASGTAKLYHTDAERQGYIDDLRQSSLLAMFYGRTPGPSLGALIYWRAGTGIIIMALIGLLMVIRHTRVEEEAGRRELVGSTVVGRHAGLAAALVAVSGASLVVGLLVALGMMSQDTPVSGSLAMGLAWAASGIVFAGVGAITAQLSEGAGPARGIGVVALAVAFVLRAAGDISAEQGGGLSWLTWTSPLGWIYEVQAYGANRWWVFGLLAAFVAVLVAVAFGLSARRDIGAGVLAPRLGPAQAGAGLRTPVALAWRLQRGALYAWTTGFVAFGLLVGGIAESAGDLLGDNAQLTEVMQRMGGTSALSDVFLAGCMGIAGTIIAAYAISAALRLRTEEAALRSEPLLATRVSRLGWAGSHLVFALLGPVVAMAAMGLAAGLTYGATTGDIGHELPRSLAGALVQLPAVWLLAGLAVAALGFLPRLAPAVAWVGLGICLLLGQLGAALQLGQALLDLSPFTHVPHIPGGTIAALPLVVLSVIAAGLIGAGLAGLRRRDMPVT